MVRGEEGGVKLWEQQQGENTPPLLLGPERVVLRGYRQCPLQDSPAGALSGRGHLPHTKMGKEALEKELMSISWNPTASSSLLPPTPHGRT